MPFEGQFSVGVLDSLVVCVFVDSEDLIIVLLLGLLCIGLSLLQLLLDTEATLVDLGSLAEIPHSLLRLPESLMDLAPFHESFGILWVHLETEIETLQGIFIL